MRISALFAMLVALACPAHADTEADRAANAAARDCMADGYLNRFADAPTPDEMDCRVIYTRSLTSDGELRQIRVMIDRNAATPPNGAMLSAVRVGVDAAAILLERLPTARIGHVALFIYDGTASDVVDGQSPLAKTNGALVRPECNVTFYQRAESVSADEIAITVAHELFHCMQYATLSAEQMNTYDSGGLWWVEGVAETLADQAIPGTGDVVDRSDDFADAIRAHEALNRMGHDSTPFFQWLVATQDLEGLMTFQRRMAGQGSASAQQAAMRDALGDDGWMDFAKAYADGDITAADGTRLATPAPEGDEIAFTDTRTVAITRGPFVLTLGKLRHDCGEWNNSVRPAGYLATKPAADWEDLPETINNFGDDVAPIPFVALNTGRNGDRLEVTSTLDIPCDACQDVATLDSCLIGEWVMSGGGPIEWMRANGMPADVMIETSEIRVRMLANGDYSLNPVHMDIEANADTMQVIGDGQSVGISGNWSAAEGKLNICPLSGEIATNVRTAEGPMMSNLFGAGGPMQITFTCRGNTMTTLMEIPGLGPMNTIYTRTSP